MHAQALDRLGLESDLRHAVDHNAFEVHYQPIVLLASGMCAGFEALVRWTRNGEAVSPTRFIPVAEELGLIEALGTWVLQQACRTFADWQCRFPAGGLECITVNVSTRQLMQHVPWVDGETARAAIERFLFVVELSQLCWRQLADYSVASQLPRVPVAFGMSARGVLDTFG